MPGLKETIMEHDIKISTKWNTDALKGLDKEEYTDTLADDGFARAIEQIAEGYREGELFSIILDEDGNEITVRGWWSVEHKIDHA
jgi:hypothetical protein